MANDEGNLITSAQMKDDCLSDDQYLWTRHSDRVSHLVYVCRHVFARPQH